MLILLFCGNFGAEFSLLQVIRMHETKCFMADWSWRLHFSSNLTSVQTFSHENVNRFGLHFAVLLGKKTIHQNVLRRFHGKLFHL